MINHFDIEKPGGFPNLVGKLFVGLTGFQIAGRVVMAENQVNCMGFQSFFKDDTRVGYCAGNTPLAYHFKMIDTIGLVKKNNCKNLPNLVLVT